MYITSWCAKWVPMAAKAHPSGVSNTDRRTAAKGPLPGHKVGSGQWCAHEHPHEHHSA
jgi:hypothetical protein